MNKEFLFIIFVHGEDIRTTSEGDGNYVHEDSCVEFFMQKEEGPSYINFWILMQRECVMQLIMLHHRKGIKVLLQMNFNLIERIATF